MKRSLAGGFLLAALAWAAPEAAAQTGTVRGKVLDDKSEPVHEALVTLEYMGGVTRKFEMRTNKRGEYTQVGLAPGVYKITATKDGFQGMAMEQRISLGEPTYVPELKLTPRAPGSLPASEGEADTLRADFKTANDLLSAGKSAEAEAAFKALAEKNPRIPEIHYNLGLIAARRGDWAVAEAAYKKALEVKPDYTAAYNALSNLYLNTNQPEKAAEMAQKAAGSAGQDPKALFQVAFVAFNSGKYEEAREAFRKAEAAGSTDPEVQYYLGSIALTLNDVDDCVARLEKYVAAAPAEAPNLTTAQALLAACKQSKGAK